MSREWRNLLLVPLFAVTTIAAMSALAVALGEASAMYPDYRPLWMALGVASVLFLTALFAVTGWVTVQVREDAS